MCRRPLLGGPVHKLGANSEGRRRLKVRSQAVGAKATALKLIQVPIVYIRCLKLIQVPIVYIRCRYAVYNMLSICCRYVVYALRLQSAVYMLLNTLRHEPQLKSRRWYTREGCAHCRRPQEKVAVGKCLGKLWNPCCGRPLRPKQCGGFENLMLVREREVL